MHMAPWMIAALVGAVLIVVITCWSPVEASGQHVFAAVMLALTLLGAVRSVTDPVLLYLVPVVIVLCLVLAVKRRACAGLLPVVLAAALPLSLLIAWTRLLDFDDLGRLTFATEMAHVVIVAGFLAYFLAVRRGARVHPGVWLAWIAALVLSTGPLLLAATGMTAMVFSSAAVALIAVTLGGIVVAVVLNHRYLRHLPEPLLWLSGLAGLAMTLVAVTGVVVWVSFAVGGPGSTETGYLVGHALVSVSWMVLAAAVLLLLTPIRGDASLWVGSVLAAAAVGKLVFFDLQALTGLARALVFLACGLVLLAIVSLRARRTDDSPGTPATVGAERSGQQPAGHTAGGPAGEPAGVETP